MSAPSRTATMWRRYVRFWGPRGAADLDDELRFHIEMRVRDYIRQGLPESEARAATAARLGDLIAARDTCVAITTRRERRMTRAETVDAFLQDLRFSLRTLGTQKAWTALVVVTLALGIGANTAVFSVVSSLLLHPLSYPHADRVAIIYQQPTKQRAGMRIMVSSSPALVRGWRQASHSLEAIEPYTTNTVVLRERSAVPTSLLAAQILPSFARFAGVQPIMGRQISEGDINGGANVVMLSEPFWRLRFGADSGIVGRPIDLDGKLFTVIGVMPASLRLPARGLVAPDLWLPLDLRDKGTGLSVVGRLKPGATFDAATKELESISARVNAADGQSDGESFKTVLVSPSQLIGFRTSLLMLSGAVALVLLIACANVAHLLLARFSGRHRELAIRAALGAGRGRILRQLVTESLVLSAAGCASGLLIGFVGLRAIVGLRPDALSELERSRLDGTTLLLTLGIAGVTAMFFGVVGGVQAAKLSTSEALKSGALSASPGRRHARLRSLLVVSEMALAVVLLVGAALLVRSIVHLQTMDPGFSPERLYAVELPMGQSDSAAAARAPRVIDLLGRVRALPGVDGAALATSTPPGNAFLIGSLEVEGYPPPDKAATSFLDYNGVSPDFFRVARMPLVSGHTFTDTSSTSREVIVNEGFARKYWATQSPIGRRIRVLGFGGKGEWKTIVGVAHDASTGGLTEEADAPLLYLPTVQYSQYLHPALLVRATTGKDPLPAIRSLAATFDPGNPPPAIIDIESAMSKSIARPRFTMTLLTVFTAFAVLLATIGLYGLMAYTVAQRTREIGIRRALGASQGIIAGGVIRQGLSLAAAGLVIGLVGATWSTRLLEKMLYGVPRTDPASFAAGAVLLIVTTLVACLVPARRAVAVDALIAMRAD